ncbi:MAG: hypothetical protein ABIS47_04405 [Acidimicrobiales bacterium]
MVSSYKVKGGNRAAPFTLTIHRGGGSTNFSWRGFYVQSNNAVILTGAKAVRPFAEAFEGYWTSGTAALRKAMTETWTDLELAGGSGPR